MSIFAGLGAVPSNFTVPLTVAAVAGSIGVGAGAADSDAGAGWDSGVSFLLQPARRRSPRSAQRPRLTKYVLFIISAPFLELWDSPRLIIEILARTSGSSVGFRERRRRCSGDWLRPARNR